MIFYIDMETSKRDQYLSRFILSYFMVSALNATIKTIFSIPEVAWKTISLIGGCFVLFYFVHSIKYILKFSGKLLFISYLGILLNVVVSIFINSTISFEGTMFWMVFICVPMGLALFSLNNIQELYDALLKCSYLLFVILSLNVIFSVQEKSYNMFLSYALAFPLLIHINECFKKFRLWHFMIIICELLVIVLFGSRGALLSVAFFCFYSILLRFNFTVKSCAWIFISCLLCILLFINMSTIGSWVIAKLSEYDIYSRTLVLLFSSDIGDLSGRDDIWNECLYLISQRPILGWGFNGWQERLVMYSGMDSSVGVYPHNIFLELCLDYGIIVGGMFSIILSLSFFQYINLRDKIERELWGILFALGMLPLIISDTYKSSVIFFLYIYFFMFTLKNKVVIKPSCLQFSK